MSNQSVIGEVSGKRVHVMYGGGLVSQLFGSTTFTLYEDRLVEDSKGVVLKDHTQVPIDAITGCKEANRRQYSLGVSPSNIGSPASLPQARIALKVMRTNSRSGNGLRPENGSGMSENESHKSSSAEVALGFERCSTCFLANNP